MTNDTLTHLRIIRTWAEVDGKSGHGIDPMCCTVIVKWIEEALKELEPVKPVMRTAHGQGADDVWYECGGCNAFLGINRIGRIRCPKCGREVKWDDI